MKMDTFPTKERAVNFSKDEKARFQMLIEKYKEILFCKKTDNNSNFKKNRTWAAIHAEFNAGGDQPRSLRQLKAKLDNMKRSARKDASQERLSRIKTGGGPPEPPVQPETEWFRSVMPVSMDGLPSVVDDDVIVNKSTATTSQPPEVIIIKGGAEVSNIQEDEHKENNDPAENIITVLENLDTVFDTKSPAALLRTPVSKPLRIRKTPREDHQSCHNLKEKNLLRTIEQDDIIYKLKIKHLEEKRKEEKEIFEKEMEILEIKKKKLLLELNLLEHK